MSALNWGMISDGGIFESLMHAILYAEDPGIILFGRPGKDSGQDARSSDGKVIYQAKYRSGLVMDGVVKLALEELESIKKYRDPGHPNFKHWEQTASWVLVANFSINPNDKSKWATKVVPAFQTVGLLAEFWSIEILEGLLAKHSHIKSVFFEGNNRVLVGLKEANDLLNAECIGSKSLDNQFIGRNQEISRILKFAEKDPERILPVIGPAGIGKSRLLYESLVRLNEDGWRVFWALPEAMSRSSGWFQNLNSNQNTCVCIDDPSDPGLLQMIVEQLAATERKTWKVLISSRDPNNLALSRFKSNRFLASPLFLNPLSENDTHELLKAYKSPGPSPAWMHSVFNYTQGNPGWVCIVSDLLLSGNYGDFSGKVENVASAYIESCLANLPADQKGAGITFLRWLSLWGVVNKDDSSDWKSKLELLASNGVPPQITQGLIKFFSERGLVRNWGIDQRLCAVEPAIIREHILRGWIFNVTGGRYVVESEGKELISAILKGGIPGLDEILHTLSNLVISSLEARDGFSFLSPVFDAMDELSRNGNIKDQYRVVELAKKVGSSDPERILDTFKIIQENPKDDVTIEDKFWGAHTYSHTTLVSKMPKILFDIARHLSDSNLAKRYLMALKNFVINEEKPNTSDHYGESAQKLLSKLLEDYDNWDLFGCVAMSMITKKSLQDSREWPFVGAALSALMNPVKEGTEWVANWTITFNRKIVLPESEQFKAAVLLHSLILEAIEEMPTGPQTQRLWNALSDSHQKFNSVIKMLPDVAVEPYRTVLIKDMEGCIKILEAGNIDLENATYARNLWSWYLSYAHEDDPLDLARKCEKLFSDFSYWRVQDFFQFSSDEQLEPETDRIVKAFIDATETRPFESFFAEAQRYVSSARSNGRDGADFSRVADLADRLSSQYDPTKTSPLQSFVAITLELANKEDFLAWHFAINLCKQYIKKTKKDQDVKTLKDHVESFLASVRDKGMFLSGLYSNPHPATVGELFPVELAILLDAKDQFKAEQLAYLISSFAGCDWDTVRSEMEILLKSSGENPREASDIFAAFISGVYLAALRYKWKSEQIPFQWVVDTIIEYPLDGRLLKHHGITWLKDKAHFRMTIALLLKLLKSRILIEKTGRPYKDFEMIPHNFPIPNWCQFDPGDNGEISGFNELCKLALEETFIARYWMPRFLAQLDPSGDHVAGFVAQSLSAGQQPDLELVYQISTLAGGYSVDKEAWSKIAFQVCSKAKYFSRNDREQIYYHLVSNDPEVITGRPGEVPEYYLKQFDEAKRMLVSEPSDSPMRELREWALKLAEERLLREKGRVEEDFHG